jgi:Family of unknown function (DUF5519)
MTNAKLLKLDTRRSAIRTDISHDLPQVELPVLSVETFFLRSCTNMLNEICNVLKTIRAWPGVIITPDRSGVCIALTGEKLGHLGWDGRIDLPFGAEVGKQLVADEMASRDPNRPDTNPVVFHIRAAADVDRAVWLFRLAYLVVDPKVDPCAVDALRPPNARVLPTVTGVRNSRL